jgi:hypothetical protein
LDEVDDFALGVDIVTADLMDVFAASRELLGGPAELARDADDADGVGPGAEVVFLLIEPPAIARLCDKLLVEEDFRGPGETTETTAIKDVEEGEGDMGEEGMRTYEDTRRGPADDETML